MFGTQNHRLRRTLLFAFLIAFPTSHVARAEDAFVPKLKRFLAGEPSPTPAKRHRKHAATKTTPKQKPNPTPTPSPVVPPPEPSPTASVTPIPEPSAAETPTPRPNAKKQGAASATVSVVQLAEYPNYSPQVRKIVDLALSLTEQNLGYIYGSADPANGGMDCSGFIYYVLAQCGVIGVPRDASQQYVWVRKAGKFQAVLSRNESTFELDALAPGDLLFWTGTYNAERDPPVTHTMIYLGREKATNKRIMVGASDGRSYQGTSRWGVSVFDFKMPRAPSKEEAKGGPVFVGYSSVPQRGASVAY